MRNRRSVLYCRTAHGGEALAWQMEQLKRYAEKENYTVVGICSDTGNGLHMAQPGIQQLLDMAARCEIDLVLATGLSRISRDSCDLIRLADRLAHLGVRIQTIQNGADTEKLLTLSRLLYADM